MGTAAYISPEQVRGAEPTPASDVYALGLVLIEALTGRRAFPQQSPHEAIAARLSMQPAIPGEFGYRWRSLLSAMTARDPQDRPTALEVASRGRQLDLDDDPADITALLGGSTGDLDDTTPAHRADSDERWAASPHRGDRAAAADRAAPGERTAEEPTPHAAARSESDQRTRAPARSAVGCRRRRRGRRRGARRGRRRVDGCGIHPACAARPAAGRGAPGFPSAATARRGDPVTRREAAPSARRSAAGIRRAHRGFPRRLRGTLERPLSGRRLDDAGQRRGDRGVRRGRRSRHRPRPGSISSSRSSPARLRTVTSAPNAPPRSRARSRWCAPTCSRPAPVPSRRRSRQTSTPAAHPSRPAATMTRRHGATTIPGPETTTETATANGNGERQGQGRQG